MAETAGEIDQMMEVLGPLGSEESLDPFSRSNAVEEVLPRRKTLGNIKDHPLRNLSRGSVNYGDQPLRLIKEFVKEAHKAEPLEEVPKELKEHARKKKTFSRLRLKRLEEARIGLYEPPSPRTVDRRARSVDRVRKIIAALKMSPRLAVREQDRTKDWKIRPSAQESPVIKGLKEKLKARRQLMKPYTSNRLYEKILEVTEEERVYPTPEDFWRQSIASQFEKMGRELIDKTAHVTARMKHGVWSQTGIPYICLGAPSTNRPSTAPLPNLQVLRESIPGREPPFDFFPACADVELMAELAGRELERRHVPLHIARREAILRAAKQTSTVSRLLMRMGLLHLHDMDNAKFPLEQVHMTADLIKRVKAGGPWMEDITEAMMKSAPRELSVAPYTGRTIVGPAGNVEHFGDDSSSSEAQEGSEKKTQEEHGDKSQIHGHPEHRERDLRPWYQKPTHAHTHGSFLLCRMPTKTLVQPEPDEQLETIDWKSKQSLVFNIKRKNLQLRKDMLFDLKLKLTTVSDRREHWRSVTKMSSEVPLDLSYRCCYSGTTQERNLKSLDEENVERLCRRLETILFITKGRRRPPSTRNLWKEAQRLHPVPKKKHRPEYDSEACSVNRFYERVCTFIDHQKMADPLMDVLIYILREILQNGHKLQADLLFALCERLARIPEDVASSGRMVCIFPILQFIAKELRVTSTEYDSFISKSGVDRLQPSLV